MIRSYGDDDKLDGRLLVSGSTATRLVKKGCPEAIF